MSSEAQQHAGPAGDRSGPLPTRTRTRPTTGPDAGFWVVALAFLVAMAFGTVPTPLWPLYQADQGFSTTAVTIAFTAYAVGVVASLFLAGHVSDWLGRRRVLLPALLLEVVAAVVFLASQDLAAVVVARLLTGVGVGMITATATAHLVELDAAARPGAPGTQAAVVATAVNAGGLAVGPLLAGALAELAPAPLTTSYLVSLVLLVLATAGVALVPETVRAEHRAYRPQRVVVPPAARGRYLALLVAASTLFIVPGVFLSTAPIFLAAVGAGSPLVAGLVAFVVLGAGAIAQVALGRVPLERQLSGGLGTIAVGVVVLAAGILASSPVGFVAGGLVAGAGAGVLLKGSVGTAAALAPAATRGEALAGVFLSAYVGLAVPVLGVGVAVAAGAGLAASLVGSLVLTLLALAAAAVQLRRHRAP